MDEMWIGWIGVPQGVKQRDGKFSGMTSVGGWMNEKLFNRDVNS